MQSYFSSSHDIVPQPSARAEGERTSAPVAFLGLSRDADTVSLGKLHWATDSSPAAQSLAARSLPIPANRDRREHSSTTWTSSSGDPDALSDADAVEDRSMFFEEYNRLAKKV